MSSIKDELIVCEQFQISVAFITMRGITPLLQTLKELEKKGIRGGILTTNYLNFSEPRALEKLNALSNITSAALTSNREWNIKVILTEQGEVVQDIAEEFNEIWNSKGTVSCA